MKKYLVIKHMWQGTFQTDNLTKEDLVANSKGDSELIVNLADGTYFDAESNSWRDIEIK